MKYLRLFETTAAYDAAESTLVKPNVSYIVETNGVEYNPINPNVFIKYAALAKLNKTWDDEEEETFGATIKSHTFENGVGTIEFDGDVTSIGDSAFYECSSLTSVTIPDSVTSIGDSAFYECSSLTSVTIPDSVTSIGNEAFNGCSLLTSVTIGSGVTTIGYMAFYDCHHLTSINIPDSVTSIGEQAFLGCTSLISVTIGSGVTSIGNSAFENCTGLTSVTVEATTPPTLGSGAFEADAEERKIYVPSASVNAYKAAENWSDYAEDIEAIPSV